MEQAYTGIETNICAAGTLLLSQGFAGRRDLSALDPASFFYRCADTSVGASNFKLAITLALQMEVLEEDLVI